MGNRTVSVNALPDTGADLSVAGEDFLQQFGVFREALRRPAQHPRAADGSVIHSVGTLTSVISLGDVRTEEEVHILPGVRGLLLSWEVTRKLRLVPAGYPCQIAAVSQQGIASPNECRQGTTPLSDAPGPVGERRAPQDTRTIGTSRISSDVKTDITERPVTSTVRPGEHLSTHPTSSGPDAGSAKLGRQPEPSEYSERSRLIDEFDRVFDGHIRTMPGEEFTIHLKPDARPFCVMTPRRIPLSLRDPLKSELDRLEAEGVIRRVTTPTEWCAPIVVTPKKGGAGVLLCVDLSQLNKYVRRELYQSPTPAEEVASIRASEPRWFTVFDALKGYHQCPLATESQLLTTFTTPFVRFAFLRARYGVTSIAEHYNRRMDEAFEELVGFRNVVDDVIIFSRTREEHVQHVRQFLARCQEKGISLNADKLQLAQQ